MNNIIDSEIIIADTIEQQATASMANPSSKPLSPSEFIGDLPECVLIGTLCKQMPKRPSVLDEYKDATLFQPSKAIDNFVISSEVFFFHSKYFLLSILATNPDFIRVCIVNFQDDTLILEDETGRISLSGDIVRLVGSLVTGVVIAVKGKEKTLGDFQVSSWIFCGGSSLHPSPLDNIISAPAPRTGRFRVHAYIQ